MPTILSLGMSQDQQEAYLIQLQIEEISRKLRIGNLMIPQNPEERSPSPELINSSPLMQTPYLQPPHSTPPAPSTTSDPVHMPPQMGQWNMPPISGPPPPPPVMSWGQQPPPPGGSADMLPTSPAPLPRFPQSPPPPGVSQLLAPGTAPWVCHLEAGTTDQAARPHLCHHHSNHQLPVQVSFNHRQCQPQMSTASALLKTEFAFAYSSRVGYHSLSTGIELLLFALDRQDSVPCARVFYQPGDILFMQQSGGRRVGLGQINPRWDDEASYHEAKRIVIGEYQNMVVNPPLMARTPRGAVRDRPSIISHH